MEKVSRGIDNFVGWEGNLTSHLIIPLLFVVVFEVFNRYILNAPTVWAFEVTMFIYGLHYMFGLTYMDLYDGHVKVDVFVNRLPFKPRKVIKIFTFLVISLPVTLGVLVWTALFAYQSTMDLEVNWTSFAPPIWPFKICVALGFLLLFLQGISNLLKTINESEEK